MQSAYTFTNGPTQHELWRRRERALSQAPRDLQALGVPHAWTVWENACTELHRLRAHGLGEVRETFQLVRLAIIASIVAEERGEREGWITPQDVTEAHLRITAIDREIA